MRGSPGPGRAPGGSEHHDAPGGHADRGGESVAGVRETAMVGLITTTRRCSDRGTGVGVAGDQQHRPVGDGALQQQRAHGEGEQHLLRGCSIAPPVGCTDGRSAVGTLPERS